MTRRAPSISPRTLSFALLLIASSTQAAEGQSAKQAGAMPTSVVAFENDRVLAEKVTIAPGQRTVPRTDHINELVIFIRGGVLTSMASGRSVWWRDGRVAWHGAEDALEAASFNSGAAPIVVVRIKLKPHPHAAHGPFVKAQPVSYPNIAGEDLLENDHLIVQRFVMQPGQWEGVHAHEPNTLWVFIKGGRSASRTKREPEHPYPRAFEDGEVGWMPAIDLTEGHESKNIDDHPEDWLWVSLKD
jgi:predicted metal-dependent enzyme (double-stranded beta helix superfamily)